MLGARCPVMAVASAVATMCWILCLFLAGLAVRLRRRREVLGPVQEKMLWDTGGARCFWVRRSGLLCRPWRPGEERFRRRALSGLFFFLLWPAEVARREGGFKTCLRRDLRRAGVVPSAGIDGRVVAAGRWRHGRAR